jgi:hypothetical protein
MKYRKEANTARIASKSLKMRKQNTAQSVIRGAIVPENAKSWIGRLKVRLIL